MKNIWFNALLLTGLLLAAITPGVLASPGQGDDRANIEKNYQPDDLPHPLGEKQKALRQQALQAKINGKANGRTHQVARGQYVELERIGEDRIWSVLGEFSDLPHNSIAEPDRSLDNTTYWVEDFNRQHYLNRLFSEEAGVISMRNFYTESSSGRYTVNGDVTEWVPVPGAAVEYDDKDFTDPFAVWSFLVDAVNSWYQSQLDAGKSPAEIDTYLSSFDVWDRYDHDGDGNFAEPDGYIDHFQAFHSGLGEEACCGGGDETAIMTHVWYAYTDLIGQVGPSPDALLGGLKIGASSYWIGNYIILPENVGVGVLAHEYGHDLGLPDLYDFSCGGCVATNWTLMSGGEWASDRSGIPGSMPIHLGAWEKLQLGWLNYEQAYAGKRSAHKLGPAETNTKQAQGLVVILPDKEVVTPLADPYSGNYFYYSSAGNNLDHFLIRQVNLAPGSTLTALVNYDIELDWDYAYLVVSTDGTTWNTVQTNLSTTYNPNSQNFGYGITGASGDWLQLTADLSGYTGSVLLGFRYWTDPAVIERGFMVDDVAITGYPLDDAESDVSWTLDGFKLSDGVEIEYFFNAYIAEYRQYRGYDDALRTGPYYRPFSSNVYWADHFPNQDGLLISYWDTSQLDNNVSLHPGEGLILPIDSHPAALLRLDGSIAFVELQSYDSTFSLEATDALLLHRDGVPWYHPSQPGVPIFDDRIQYWNPLVPDNGVQNPHTGTMIKIRSISAQGGFMQVQVSPSK